MLPNTNHMQFASMIWRRDDCRIWLADDATFLTDPTHFLTASQARQSTGLISSHDTGCVFEVQHWYLEPLSMNGRQLALANLHINQTFWYTISDGK